MDSEEIRLIQLSDLHLATERTFELKGVNTYQSASQVMQAINAPSIDAVVVSGDISEDGSIASYQHFKALCHQHHVQVPYSLPGNHDNIENMAEQLRDTPYCESLCLKNWLFIFVNTHRQGFDDGYIGPAEYQRMASLLAHYPEQHVVLFMHHHALLTGSTWIDQYRLIESDKFIAWLRRFPTIRAVINGHIHQAFFAEREGVAFYGTPSTCVQFIQAHEKAEVAELGPGYRELVFKANGEIDTQVVYLPLDTRVSIQPNGCI